MDIKKIFLCSFFGFSVGDYLLTKVADLGTGKVWKELRDRLPKNKESLEVQLYNIIEICVKKIAPRKDYEQIAPACEIIYGTWINQGNLTTDDIKKALTYLYQPFSTVTHYEIDLWYQHFSREITQDDNVQLYRWYTIHCFQKEVENKKTRDELLIKQNNKILEEIRDNDINDFKADSDYIKTLKKSVLQPILGEEVCLNDIFIPLYGKLVKRNYYAIGVPLDKGGEIVITTDYLVEWYRLKGTYHLFLHGEPGCGKSSLLKMLSTLLADESNGMIFFINLYKLNFSDKKDAIDVVKGYIEDKYPSFFNREIKEKRLLILDGLDEIRYKVYENSLELTRGLENYDWGVPCSCIVSGRTQIVLKAVEFVTGEILEILPLFLSEYEKKKRLYRILSGEELLEEDLRELHWKKLTKAFGLDEPFPLAEEKFNELSTSPLLLFLIVWTMKHSQTSFVKFRNITELYETIFEHIYTRLYNRQDNKNATTFLPEYVQYKQMLHHLGGCACRNRSRTVSIQNIYEYCIRVNAEKLCTDWIQIQKDGTPSKLVLLFFLREEHNKIDWNKSEIEFIHKTFYEYLAAVGVVEVLYRYSAYDTTYDYSAILLYQFAESIIDDEILKFIKELIQNGTMEVQGEKINEETFCQVITELMCHYYNINYPFSVSNHDEGLSKLTTSTYSDCISKTRIYEENLQKLLELFTKGDIIYKPNLSRANFAYTNIICWDFSEVNLEGCSFLNSVLSGAIFKRCNLRRANFSFSVSDRVNFSETNLHNTIFQSAQLAATNFDRAFLKQTNFEEANLECAFFTNLRLNEVNFKKATLQHATFKDGTIEDTNFLDTDLSYAYFENVNINKVNWRNCTMNGAVLKGIKLVEFDLDNIDIIQMLKGADLQYADWTGVSDEKKEDFTQ